MNRRNGNLSFKNKDMGGGASISGTDNLVTDAESSFFGALPGSKKIGGSINER